jgi:hypothetical protein
MPDLRSDRDRIALKYQKIALKKRNYVLSIGEYFLEINDKAKAIAAFEEFMS